MVTDMLYSSIRVDLHRRIALAPPACRGSRHPETPVCDVEDEAVRRIFPGLRRFIASGSHRRKRAHGGAGDRRRACVQST
jgi:hypothetical protein